MNDWLVAAFLGLMGVAVMLGFAWMRGASPRRLVWQDLSRVRVPDEEEREVLEANLRLSMKIYAPLLIGAVVFGALLMADGEPLGLALLICFGVPPVLALVRAVRVLRFLRGLDD